MSKNDLYLAVLEQGIRDYTEGMKPAEVREYVQSVQDRAEEWLFSDSKEPMSFLWYCRQLGIEDPDAIRDAAREQRAEEEAKRQKRSEARKKK